jgi:CBS domain-containing protein
LRDQRAGLVSNEADHDIALGTRNTRAALLRVGAVATTKVVTCGPDDEVEAALSMMKEARVRRLPIVDANRKLIGIISLNDIALAAGDNTPVRDRDVVDALKSICAHRRKSTDRATA